MNKIKCDKVSRKHTILTVLGITTLAFLILSSIAGAALFLGTPNSGHYNESNLNKALENDMKTQDEVLQRNPLDSNAWGHKGDDLAALDRNDEALIAYDQAIGLNPQNSAA